MSVENMSSLKDVCRENVAVPVQTLAYYENSQITTAKSFIPLGPVTNVIKLFTALSYKFS
jgi:hypothetical protein